MLNYVGLVNALEKEGVDKNNLSQFTLLIGNHFADLKTLVDNYLPKAAIDRITKKMHNILRDRGKDVSSQSGDSEE